MGRGDPVNQTGFLGVPFLSFFLLLEVIHLNFGWKTKFPRHDSASDQVSFLLVVRRLQAGCGPFFPFSFSLQSVSFFCFLLRGPSFFLCITKSFCLKPTRFVIEVPLFPFYSSIFFLCAMFFPRFVTQPLPTSTCFFFLFFFLFFFFFFFCGISAPPFPAFFQFPPFPSPNASEFAENRLLQDFEIGNYLF